VNTWVRYLLFQVPGWVIAVGVLLWLRYGAGLPVWAALWIFVLWVVKDLALYPLLRPAYESGVKAGSDQLVGLPGVAREDLNPRGYVHVRGELWRAELEPGDPSISAGSPIRVVAARGMTLVVAPGEDRRG
jgi:membrane protein implicated in regulation of membrane protease activity